MPVSINLYEIGDFESNHFGDRTTTLEMLSHYSMKEPNTDDRQGRPDRTAGACLNSWKNHDFTTCRAKADM